MTWPVLHVIAPVCLVSMGLAGGCWSDESPSRSDRESAIEDSFAPYKRAIEEFFRATSSGELDRAYDLLSPSYTGMVSRQAFVAAIAGNRSFQQAVPAARVDIFQTTAQAGVTSARGLLGEVGRAEVFFTDQPEGPRISAVTIAGMPALPSSCAFAASAAAPAASPPGPGSSPNPPAAGSVVVRSATSAGRDGFDAISVHCLDSERLIGGGCGGGCALVVKSEPIGYGRADTTAAGWRCQCSRTQPPEPPAVFALCQQLSGPIPAEAR